MANGTDALVLRLKALGGLSDADQQSIRELPTRLVELERGQEIATDGEITSRCCMVVSGFMHRFKVLPDGKRQILSFHVPGDIPDLQSLYLKKMDHSLAATMHCTVALISHKDMKAAMERAPGLVELLWRDTLVDAASFRIWMTMMGQADADARMAHLFCELYKRLEVVGHSGNCKFELPITQTELGDALGITPVHVNRTLQELRGRKLLELERHQMTILNWEGLRELAQFEVAYLHLR